MDFKIITELPHELDPKAIDEAVYQFVHQSGCEDNKVGFYNQTIAGIGNAIKNGTNQFFWLEHEDGKVVAYAMTHVARDVDNSLCYYMTQAWIRPEYRHTKATKERLEMLRAHAKALQCRHIIIPSSRGLKGYLRFLGKKWHLYVHLLKEDI